MKINDMKTFWREPKGFELNRQSIGNQYIFIHFLTPITIVLDGVKHHSPAGSCIIYNKLSPQRFIVEECTLFHNWCHIDGDLDDIMKSYGLEYNYIYHCTEGSSSDRLISLMSEIEAEYLLSHTLSKELIELKICEILLTIARDAENPNNNSNKFKIDSAIKDQFITLRREMNYKYSENWDIPRMLSFVNLSASRFYEVYELLFESSPKRDLQTIRIEHAKSLLRQKNYTVKDVSEMVGYTNEYHFIRQFKKITGVTPGKFE